MRCPKRLIKLIVTIFITLCCCKAYAEDKWPFDPQNILPDVYKVFGEWDKNMFHPAIDFPAIPGTPVKSVKCGYVLNYNNVTSGKEGSILIGDSPSSTEGWGYGHIANIPEKYRKEGAKVDSPCEDEIAKVSDFTPSDSGDSDDHLDFGKIGTAGYFVFINPFTYYSSQIIPNQISSIATSKIFFTPDKKWEPNTFTATSDNKKIIYGDVDIVAEPHTKINNDERSCIYNLKYEIINPPAGSSGISQRTLAEFRELKDGTTNYSLVYAMGANPPSTHFHAHYIVTNCKPGTPDNNNGISNVIENAWFTKVKKDIDDSNGGITSSQMARINEEAKYKDGEYTVKITASAYKQTSPAEQTVQIILDNYLPYAQRVIVKFNDATYYDAAWNWNGSTLELTPPNIDYTIPLTANTISFEITFSEPMNDVGIGIDTLGISAALSSNDTEKKIWKGSFAPSVTTISEGWQGIELGDGALKYDKLRTI